LGIAVDWSALCIGRIAPEDGRFIIEVIRTWRPEPGNR